MISLILKVFFLHLFKILEEKKQAGIVFRSFAGGKADYAYHILQGCCQMLLQAMGQNLPPVHVLSSHWHQ